MTTNMARCLSTLSFNKFLGVRFKSFSSHDWLARRLKDPYIEKAKRENYRCRSAFKLMEIDDKYKFLRPGLCVLDIGAAPGSWSQVLVNRTNATGKDPKKYKGTVISIDLLPIYQLDGATILPNMDFTDPAAQLKIAETLNGRKLHFVFSDMAPNATGVKSLDQQNIFTLALAVLTFAVKNGAVNSGCLVKMWQSEFCKTLVEEMSRFYNNVHYVKPNASQSDSAETFLLAREFKGLKQNES